MREASHIWSPLDSVCKLKKVRRIRPYTADGPPGPESVAFFRNALPDEPARSYSSPYLEHPAMPR
jgi:hypothetical protein